MNILTLKEQWEKRDQDDYHDTDDTRTNPIEDEGKIIASRDNN